MVHPEAHQCKVRRNGQHGGILKVKEDGSKICAVHDVEDVTVRRCLVINPGSHWGQLKPVGNNLFCEAHLICAVDDPGNHVGGKLQLVNGELRCEGHGGVDLVKMMVEVAQEAEQQNPLPPPPTPRSHKNIPQRGRPRVKSNRR